MNKSQKIKFLLGLAISLTVLFGISEQARAADVVLGSGFDPMFNGKQVGVIWTGVDTGYLFIRDVANNRFQWTKTTDGGQTFSTPTTFDTLSVSFCAFGGDVFYDRWTPGVTTQYIHLYYYTKSTGGSCSVSGGSNYKYYRFDVENDVFDITVNGSGNVCFSTCAPFAISISRAANGYLYRGFLDEDGSNLVYETSTNDGGIWTLIADPPCGMRHLFPVRPNSIFFIDDHDISGVCPNTVSGAVTDLSFYVYQRDANAWGPRFTYTPDYGTDTIVCNTNRVIDSSSGQYYLVVSGSIGGACFATNSWVDVVTHNVNNLGLSTSFSTHNVFENVTVNSPGYVRGIYSATEDILYVFDVIPNALDDDIVFYSSENINECFTNNCATWSEQQLFDSEEQNRAAIYLSEAITGSGGWIYPIWRNNTGGTYDTNLLAIFTQLPVFQFPGEHPPEEILQGFTDFLGTWLFVGIVAFSIIFLHIAFRWPYEMMYPFGLIVGAILGHPTVAIIEPWWIIAAIALIAALYIYRIILSPSSDSGGQ